MAIQQATEGSQMEKLCMHHLFSINDSTADLGSELLFETPASSA